ncbi:MAG: MFS transporter [Dehalococcoidales bacterium]|nr:MFS transporter [Dehalococcoidales bacterium]
MEKQGNPENQSSSRGIFYGWYLVAIAWTMAFLGCGTSLGIFFKPILDEFQWERSTLSLISATAMLIFAALSPFVGRLIDRFGPRVMLFCSVIAQVLSNAVTGLAGGIGSIFAGRLLFELKPIHSSQVLINHWFIRKRGSALGILSTGIPLGTLVLSPVSQYLVSVWGWRTTFFFWAGVMAVIVLPLLLFIRNWPQEKGMAADGVREERVAQEGTPSYIRQSESWTIAPADLGYTLAEAIRSHSFWLLAATQLFCGIGCGLMMTHTVIFAIDLGYHAIIGASFLSVQGGVSLLGVLVTGQMSDRMARNKVLSLTHIIRCISFVSLAAVVLLGGGPLWMLYLAMVFFGFGWFTTAPLAAGMAADLFGFLRLGTILGIILACHAVGMAIGTYAGGLTFQLSGSYFPIFLVQCVLELAAAIFAYIIIRKNTDSK